MAGTIGENIQFRKYGLKATDCVYGYLLPLKQHPPPSTERNNRSSLRNAKFAEDSVEQLLLSRCIREVHETPYCTNPITVAEGKKLRLVLDLRNVNQYLNITKFKYEGLQTVRDIIDANDFFVTFDLKKRLSSRTGGHRASQVFGVCLGIFPKPKIFRFRLLAVRSRYRGIRIHKSSTTII